MELHKMFEKDIYRDIKGVIKIGQDDDANVYQELEEYVVTRELGKHFSTFFDAYKKSINTYTDKMGIWISGFFGSGKSHFLKILSYLLENREVRGEIAVAYFEDKIKDPMVLADMKRAGDISTDVLLFNIDSKSESDSRSSKEPIVRVFNKVFNEIQGLCSSLPWLAELERQMQKEDTFETFQGRYEDLSGKPWTESREDYFFEEDNIVKALAETTRMSEDSARHWYHRAEENYSLSVEKFANKVKEYIESKGKEHHVVFMVDEMGQYIGDDVGLMLNLQTVVEDLGTYCGGKAWVVVTSQQDIDTVTRVKGQDFSKILGRFNTRLSLSGANVDEVIKKRILYKNEVGRETLKLLYGEKEAILKNLITFSSDTPEMKTFQKVEDFIEDYPFVPYHFRLLQSVFTAVRIHGASGKHLAEGERSMLSAYQEATQQYANSMAGTLIPFSTFYETIEAFLDHNIRTVILQAEDNERLQKNDVEVLKVLFLIKWVKEMPANLENLATLMVNHTDEDKIERKKQIEASLERLLKETLVQKNGNEYLFLTHEEQDVNREIKNIPVDLGEVVKNVGEEIFTGIFSEKRFRYSTRYHFDFNKIIDDRNLTAFKSEIGVKVITPYFDIGRDFNEQDLKMMSAREKSLVIKLPPDTTALEEMEDIFKIQTFLTRKGGASATAEIQDIKNRKAREVGERKDRVRSLLVEALQEANFYANAQKVELRSKHPAERINNGLKVLIDSIYSKLNYINSFIESTKELQDILVEQESQLKLDNDYDEPNKLALEEIKGFIERCFQRNIPVTMKSLLDLYSKAPYGWLENDIRGLVLRHFKSQEIKLQLGGEYLVPSDKDLVQYTIKKDYVDRLLIKKREKVSEALLQNARNLMKELFNVTALPGDEDSLMQRFKDLARNELEHISRLLVYYEDRKYPGKIVLEDGRALLKGVLEIKDVLQFFEKLHEVKDELLSYEENNYDVKKFFENQKEYFDKALHHLEIYEKNKTYVLDNETIQTVKEVQEIIYSPKPYSQISSLPSLMETFRSRFVQLLEEETKPVKDVIESDRQKVRDELEKYSFKDELSPKFQDRFKDLLDRLGACNNFYEAIAMKEESDRLKMRCFEEIEKKKQENEEGVKPQPKKEVTVSIRNIFHGVGKIETEEDIEQFLDHVRRQIKKELKENTTIKFV